MKCCWSHTKIPMTKDKKTKRLMPKPGPEKYPEIPDSVHTAAQKVARSRSNSSAKSNAQIVAERQEKHGKKGSDGKAD